MSREWRVCLAKRCHCPVLLCAQSLVLMGNHFWKSTCSFMLFGSISVIFPFAEHCRKQGLTAERVFSHLPSISGHCRRPLLKQGCCSFLREVLLLGSFTLLRWKCVHAHAAQALHLRVMLPCAVSGLVAVSIFRGHSESATLIQRQSDPFVCSIGWNRADAISC